MFKYLYDPLEQFDIVHIFNVCSFVVITNLHFVMIVIVLVIAVLFKIPLNSLFLKKMKIIDIISFVLILFLWDLMNQNIVVKEQRFIGYYYILFLFLIVANVSGMVPYSLTLTSYLIITLFFSLTTFLGIVIVGESTNGNHAFHKTKLPMYVPLPIAKLLVAIEFLSYVARVFSLSIRLFANMMAGHTLLKILIGFVWGLLCTNFLFFIISSVPLVLILLVTFLEVCIAFLQAYVYMVLISIYLNDSLHIDH